MSRTILAARCIGFVGAVVLTVHVLVRVYEWGGLSFWEFAGTCALMLVGLISLADAMPPD